MSESDKLYLDPRRITTGSMNKLSRGYRLVHGDIMTCDDLAIMNLGEAKAYLAAADQADISEALADQDALKPAPQKSRRLKLSSLRRLGSERYVLTTSTPH